jgi:hypothetical protein
MILFSLLKKLIINQTDIYIPKMIQKLGIWQGDCANFFVWSERPLCKHKARVKTKNLLHCQRSQKPTFGSFSVYVTMKQKVLFFIIAMNLFLLSEGVCEAPRICLNMIVKNESHVIERCLESVKPLIDYWVIVDTGSEDKTQEIIKKMMQGIPGELHERAWINFEHNRNEALALAKDKADYLFFIDADDILSLGKDFKKADLDRDFYFVRLKIKELFYDRIQLVKSSFDWKWVGVVHEIIECAEAKTSANLEGAFIQIL